jgi:hypothetical protein
MSNPYDVDALRDALDHIMRVAKTSRSDSRRDSWIAYRTHCALTGSDDWQNEKIPNIGLLRQKIKLREQLRLACDSLKEVIERVQLNEDTHDAIDDAKAVLRAVELEDRE